MAPPTLEDLAFLRVAALHVGIDCEERLRLGAEFWAVKRGWSNAHERLL
jgi:hypothetical protein